ncbi:MAG: alpha/beta hydrolase [Calothrix sp. SM1_7_51]|nr:alpha/beta hydrolase [Calothrix sp. SM1_7_51]
MFLHRPLAFIASTCIILSSLPAFAAERVVFKYRVFRESISVEDLSTFANTGKIRTILPVDIAVVEKKAQHFVDI